MGVEIIESIKAALIDLKLREGASLTEVRSQYLEKTSHPKFLKVMGPDETLKKEFLKYHVAYLSVLKFTRENDPEAAAASDADLSFYPKEQIFRLHMNQGVYYFLNQDYIKASEKFQEAYKFNNQDPMVLIYLGILLLKRKNYYAAEKYFKEAVTIDKNNEDGWFYLAENYFKAGEFKKALPMYDTVKNLNPSRAEIAPRIKEIREKLGEIPGSKKSKKGEPKKGSWLSRLLGKSPD